MLTTTDGHPLQRPHVELVSPLPKMNQISTWSIEYGDINITFLEDPKHPENKILLKVLCEDGIVYIVQTRPLGCRSWEIK